MKSKTWEEEFENIEKCDEWGDNCNDYHGICPENTKAFIASQIEKTRREAEEHMLSASDEGETDLKPVFDDGFKAGIQKAIELMEIDSSSKHSLALENLKKEIGEI